METLLAADIGGTKTELAIFPRTGPACKSFAQQRFTNAEFTGVEEIIGHFFSVLDHPPRFACLAVAGVVSGDLAQLTNLPWKIDCRMLEKRFGFSQAVLINDLTAVCSSLALLEPADLMEIQAGDSLGGEVRGVVAPGTGLGEGLLVDVGGRVFAHGSEGGHVDFAPVDEEQLALLAWMQKKIKPVSYETLIAGPGLAYLYEFCKEHHRFQESAWIVEAMNKATDKIPVIVSGATGIHNKKICPLCRYVIDLFLSILGSEAGNLALKLYARGGIYLGGGILPRLMGRVKFDGFLQSFHDKGKMSAFMEGIPIHLILRKDAAVIGAAGYARQELKKVITCGK